MRVKKLDKLTTQILSLLQKDFKIFFRHAIEHLVQDNSEYNQTLYVFSIQQALELLIKIYVVNQYGVLSILDFEQTHDICFKLKTEEELLNLLNNQKLKTREYHKLLEIFTNESDLAQHEKDLLSNFQKLRNQIVHMGIGKFSSSISSDVNRLIATIFNRLEFKEHVRIYYNDMENTLKHLLGDKLFEEYLSKTSIVKDTEKYIYDNFESQNILYCLECFHKTVVYENSVGEYRCYLCGYQLHDDYVGILECPECFRKTFYFDTLNISPDNSLEGNCPACGSHFLVAQCANCKEFYFPHISSCSCKV